VLGVKVGQIVRLSGQRSLRRLVYVSRGVVAVEPRLRETSVVGGRDPIVWYRRHTATVVSR
jgi:hypothetical protein